MIWEHNYIPLAPMQYWQRGQPSRIKFSNLYVDPEPEYPAGRKGFVLANGWKQLGRTAKADGMLILDGDVAADPEHVRLMFNAIHDDPESVWTAPVKIWPVSTHRDDWVWAHWAKEASQEIDDSPEWFSFCFTYLPARLMENAIRGGLENWAYPRVDSSMSRRAIQSSIKTRVVADCFPTHCHF